MDYMDKAAIAAEEEEYERGQWYDCGQEESDGE